MMYPCAATTKTGLRLPFTLQLASMASPDAVQLFAELGSQFELDPKVTTWLTAPDGLAAKRLDDLLYACNEDGVDKLAEAAYSTV